MKCTRVMGLVLATTSGVAFGADIPLPTVYGRVIKEYRYVDQRLNSTKGGAPGTSLSTDPQYTGTPRRTTTGVKNVDSWEPNIGIKGSLPNEDIDVTYNLELGLNEARDYTTTTANAERIRVRMSNIKLKNKFGQLTIGQDWLPDSLVHFAMDPMAGTSFNGLGLDFSDIALQGLNGEGFGYNFRTFSNQVAYKSPALFGTTLSAAIDNSSAANAANNTALDRYVQRSTWVTGVLDSTQQLGYASTLRLAAIYAREIDNSGGAQGPTSSKRYYWNGDAQFKIKRTTLVAMYGWWQPSKEREYGNPLDAAATPVYSKKNERTKLLVGGRYDLSDRWNILATYILHKDAMEGFNNSGAAAPGTTDNRVGKSKDQLIAGGIGYDYSKNIKAKILVGEYKVDNPEAASWGIYTTYDNRATIGVFNLGLSF